MEKLLKNIKIEEQLNNCVFVGKKKNNGERVFIFTIGQNVVEYPTEKIQILADDLAKIVKDLNIEYVKIISEIGNKINNTIALFFLLFKTQSYITDVKEQDTEIFFFSILKDLKNFITNENNDKNNVDRLNEVLTLANIFKYMEKLERGEKKDNIKVDDSINNFTKSISGEIDIIKKQLELL